MQIESISAWTHINTLLSQQSSLTTESLCGSRTGGWSLPGVMSDWQHGADWFLAKYCRYRLRLHWCWCRWRTSAKGRCRWGLQVWRRQVGLVRGTRWPAESSADRMVARIARWSLGRFLGWASKPRSSRDCVGAESWVVIGGGYTEFAGFPVLHQKITGFLGWSTKTRPKNRRRKCNSIEPIWPVGTGLTGEEQRCRGSLTAGSKFLGLRAGPRMVAQTRGTQDLYWFGPPRSNTLRPVRAAVLFALICSRGYKWAREGRVPKSL
jgi:hypothetical protein